MNRKVSIMAGHLAMSILIMTTTFIVCTHVVRAKGPFDWMAYDQFDEIDFQMRSVNGRTCRSRNREQMVMRADVISQLPVYNQLLSRVWYTNRTALIHLHNMALNRAFFNSYILQKMNTSETFHKQPNWSYYYFSAAADVNANPDMLNGSTLYFDQHCHYPNWYSTVPFNNTLPMFAPKAFRWEDYQDQDNFLREPSRTVVKVNDAGAGSLSNYTHPRYKMNTWYSTWLPDIVGDKDSITKFTYYIGIKKSNKTGQFTTEHYDNDAFFGPPSPGAKETDPRMLPVQWTPPYFDCGGSNKWVVSAVSPVVDYMPRYSNYTHLRRQRIVGLIVMDIDFNKIDFNACGVSQGNPGPNFLSGIDRCKKTTSCKHKSGLGFRRGGYICVCKAGTRYPWHQEPPYQGLDIEQATEQEYKMGFVCYRNDLGQALPTIDQVHGVAIESAGMTSQGLDMNIVTGGGDRRQRRQVLINVTSLAEKYGSQGETLYYLPNGNAEVLYQDNVSYDMKDVNSQEQMHDWTGAERGVQAKGTKQYTVYEVMELVDRLKHLQDKRVSSLKESAGYDYVLRNNVGVDIEKEYQKDVEEHLSLKRLMVENKSSLGREVHWGRIVNKGDRHIQQRKGYIPSIQHQRRRRDAIFDEQALDRMMRIIGQKSSVTPSNCHLLPKHQLTLPGDVGYGAKTQFQPEGRTALRLTHFLSAYLQNVIAEENFGTLRGGGRLHMDHMFGEVLANVMANFRIYSAGLYFDRYKFENEDGSVRELFGPWAFRSKGAYYVMDTAGLASQYVNEDWFLVMKARFQSNFKGVRLFKLRAHVRSDPNGTSSIRHEYYPLTYRAATYSQGHWGPPHFRCDGKVNAWVMTYTSPFFGVDSLRTQLQFRGVATVDVPLNLLEINQCPQPFTVANAFKNTARCDYFSTKCDPLPGFPFLRGSYTCKCRLGFEYWHADGKEWFEGTFMELEYEKKMAGIFSRFDHLYCRPALGNVLLVNWVIIWLGLKLNLFFWFH